MTITSIVVGALGTVPQGLIQGVEDLKITGQVDTIQNTEKRHGDLKLAVTQTSVKDH